MIHLDSYSATKLRQALPVGRFPLSRDVGAAVSPVPGELQPRACLRRVFVEDNAFLGFRGGQSGWLLPNLASMSRGVRILADEVKMHAVLLVLLVHVL